MPKKAINKTSQPSNPLAVEPVGWTLGQIATEFWQQKDMGVLTDDEIVDQLVLRTGERKPIIEVVIDRIMFETSVTVHVLDAGK